MGKIPKKYTELKENGTSASEMANLLYEDGIKGKERMLIISKLFNLNFRETKEAVIIGDNLANSLEEYQEKIVPDVIEAIHMMINEDIADE